MRVNSRRDCQQRSWRRGGFGLALAILLTGQAAPPIRLSVDATEASRKIFHVHMLIPNPPPDLTLYFAKWIPGEHSPSGQITNLVGLKITTNGQPVAWQRDPVEMYEFHVDVPPFPRVPAQLRRALTTYRRPRHLIFREVFRRPRPPRS